MATKRSEHSEAAERGEGPEGAAELGKQRLPWGAGLRATAKSLDGFLAGYYARIMAMLLLLTIVGLALWDLSLQEERAEECQDRAVACAELGGTVERRIFNPSSYGLHGPPEAFESCVDGADLELERYDSIEHVRVWPWP